MNICGITLIQTPNYGNILQSYALQKCVESFGHKYDLINYENRDQELKFSFLGKTQYMSWTYWLYKKLMYPIQMYRIKQIVSFQDKYCNLTQRYKAGSLQLIKNDYDAFITGSDQVWNNQEVNHFDPAFFLNFAEGLNTISYAASFGKTEAMLNEKDKKFYRDNIKCIRHISVREESGKEIVSNYSLRNDAKLVCDPVFLLSADEWKSVAKKPSKQNYILLYLIGNSVNQKCNKKIMRKAQQLSKESGLPIIKIGRGISSIINEGSWYIPKTEEWLGLVENASLIVTNSFHGTAFSIIFRKNFVSFVDGNENSKMNTRIYSILKHLNLESQLKSIDASVKHDNLVVDYTQTEAVLKDFIDESKSFLRHALNDDTDMENQI